MKQDGDLKQNLKIWSIKAPPDDFAVRIVCHAVCHPQVQSVRIKFFRKFESILGHWEHGFSVSLASIALIAFFGLSIGLSNGLSRNLAITEEAVDQILAVDEWE